MKKIKIIHLALLLSAAVLSGCSADDAVAAEKITNLPALDLSQEDIVSQQDSHGGFHNDGITFITVNFSEHHDDITEALKNSGEWASLPLSDPVTALVYGVTTGDNTTGPFLTDDHQKPLIPVIQNGYYYFLDRHAEHTDQQDAAAVLTRNSFNFTLAVYDADTRQLYYAEMDT